VFVRGDRVVHACVPVVDISGGGAVVSVAREGILGFARAAFVAESSILPPIAVSTLRPGNDVVIRAFEVQSFIHAIDFIEPFAG